MTQTPAFNRMRELIDLLDTASRAYYQEDREIMSNLAYDQLYEELEGLERTTGVRLSSSPTIKVGYEVVGSLRKVAHETPMLSLDKTKDIQKLVAFLQERVGLLSWKLDGLTVVLQYTDGQLVQAVTRGNGYVGEDVTHTARVFANLPLSIPYTRPLTIRGEAVIGYTDFERINAYISDKEDRYKNPRNLCSGTVRQLNSEVAAGRRVQFYAFGLLGAEPDSMGDSGGFRSTQLAWLASLGFSVVTHEKVTASTVVDRVTAYKQRVETQDIASDGLVLAYDEIAYGESLGVTAKFPRDAIAFKWADELCETTFLAVEWNTSRTGLINPVAVFEPVEIEGTIVNRASLHNVSIMRGFALGKGDRITVYKANMIIPQVAENITRSGTESVPDACPECGEATEVLTLREGEALYCQNPHCRAQLVRGLVHFVGRDAMNMEGLSEQTLEKLVEQGIVQDYADLFTLAAHEQTIVEMEGFGPKSFANLIASINKAADVSLPNLIYALGIRQVGLSNAKLLCAHFAYDLNRIITAARSENYTEALWAIKGFGEVIAHNLHQYFSKDKNLALLNRALVYLRIQPPPEAQEKVLSDLIFVVTGEVVRFENRKALTAFIERHGGRTTGSVTAKTSFLINNDATSRSSKNKKAAELGVPILTEDAFLTRFNLNP